MKLAEKQQQLTAELAALKNGQDRFARLVERAKRLPSLHRNFARSIICFPVVWQNCGLCPSCGMAAASSVAISDSLVVKAIAGLLCDFYSDQPPAAILAHNPDFLAPLGITQHLTPNRRNALAKVWERIRQFAEANAK